MAERLRVLDDDSIFDLKGIAGRLTFASGFPCKDVVHFPHTATPIRLSDIYTKIIKQQHTAASIRHRYSFFKKFNSSVNDLLPLITILRLYVWAI